MASTSSKPPPPPPSSPPHSPSLSPSPPSSPPQEDLLLTPSTLLTPLSTSTVLTRKQLLQRRLHRIKLLSKIYREHYWALMEDLRFQFRDYYWKFGLSPFKDGGGGLTIDPHNDLLCGNGGGTGSPPHQNNNINNFEGSGENVNNCGGEGVNGVNGVGCAFVGCKLKAMALTSFCHLHILSDPQQRLYKACNYVIKSAQAGPILCGKPILKSSVPSLCNIHLQKSQKHVSRALKKAGLNVSASTKLAPKFHVVLAEYVRQIQSKRRVAAKISDGKGIAVKDEPIS